MTALWKSQPPLSEAAGLLTTPGKWVHGTIAAGVSFIPLVIAAGLSAGPVLYVQAMQHGLELNGADVMRRLIQNVEPKEICGTLILIPIANPSAAGIHKQSFPHPDGDLTKRINDMNRRWGKHKDGTNNGDKLITALLPIIEQADVLIDLHCHESIYPSMVQVNMADPICAELAEAAGFAIVWSHDEFEGQACKYCREVLGKPTLMIEMQSLGKVNSSSELGYKGVLNIMKYMGMIEGVLELPDEIAVFGCPVKTHVAIAEKAGFVTGYCHGGEKVLEGQCIIEIRDPERFCVVQKVKAPFDSHVISVGIPPQNWGGQEQDFANVGDQLAFFSKASQIRTPMESS